MSNKRIVTLDNGLKIYLFKDNTKNRTYGAIYTFAGGRDNHFIYDDKEYNQVNGIAHFLEHYLLEKSKYGNIMSYYDNEYISSNGVTSQDETMYYISTVHDFEENFIKLINVVNDPRFDEEVIENVKKPIISEINRSNDNPYQDFNKFIYSNLYKNIKYNITLGTEDNIKGLTIDDIRVFHEAFYRPSNQAILITGKFDEDEIIELIINEYDKFDDNHKKIIKDEIHEPVEVINPEATYVDKDKDEEVDIIYKIDVSNLSGEEKYKLDFYMSYLLKNNFSEKAPIFNEIRKRDITPYSPRYDFDITQDKNLFNLSFGLTTSKHDEAIELFDRTFNNMKYDEESFKIFKNKTLINIINRIESIHSIGKNYFNVLMDYDYECIDDIEFVNKTSLEECIEMFNKIDFSNKCVIKRIKGE